jgi:hypothetical protein
VSPIVFSEVRYGNQSKAYGAKVQEGRGVTDAYREPSKCTQGYRLKVWAEQQAHGERIETELALAMGAGRAPDSDEVMSLAVLHRLWTLRLFYPCSHQMQTSLAPTHVLIDSPSTTTTGLKI